MLDNFGTELSVSNLNEYTQITIEDQGELITSTLTKDLVKELIELLKKSVDQ
jgi:cellobiose-specific phosphotransferase system component IIA